MSAPAGVLIVRLELVLESARLHLAAHDPDAALPHVLEAQQLAATLRERF